MNLGADPEYILLGERTKPKNLEFQLEPETLRKVFILSEEFGQDDHGRSLDIYYRKIVFTYAVK